MLSAANRKRIANKMRIDALKKDLENPAHSEAERQELLNRIAFMEGKKDTSSHKMSSEAVTSGVSFKGSGAVSLVLLTDPKYTDSKTYQPKANSKDKNGKARGPSTLNKTRGSPMVPFYTAPNTSFSFVCDNFDGLILTSAPFEGKRQWIKLTPESVIYNSLWGEKPPGKGWVLKDKIEFKAYKSKTGIIGTSIDQPPKKLTPIEGAPYDMRDIWEVAATHRTPSHLYPIKNMPTHDDAYVYYNEPTEDTETEEGGDEGTSSSSSGGVSFNNKAMNAALRVACRNMMSVDHPMYTQAVNRDGVLHPLYEVNGYQRITGEEVVQCEPIFGTHLPNEEPASTYGSPFLSNPTKQWIDNNKELGWDEKTMPIPRCSFNQQLIFSDPKQQNEDGSSKVTDILLVEGVIWAEQLEALGVTNPKHVAAFYPSLITAAMPFVRGEIDLSRTTGLDTNTETGAVWEGDVRCYGLALKIYELIVDWMQMLCNGFLEISQLAAFKLLGRFLKHDLGLDVDDEGYVISTDAIPSASDDPIIKHIAFKKLKNDFNKLTNDNIVNAFESKVTFERPRQEDGEHKQFRFFLLTNATFKNEELLMEIRELYYKYFLAPSVQDPTALEASLKEMSLRVSNHFLAALEGDDELFSIPENHQFTIFLAKRGYTDKSGSRARDFSFLGTRPVMPPASDTSRRAEQTRERIANAARKPSEILEELGLMTDTMRNNVASEAFLNDNSTQAGAENKASESSFSSYIPPASTPVEDDESNPYAGFNISIGASEASSSSDTQNSDIQAVEEETQAPVEDDETDEQAELEDTKNTDTKTPNTKTKKKAAKSAASSEEGSKGKAKRKRDASSTAPSTKKTSKKQK